jgi:hypothetical protein
VTGSTTKIALAGFRAPRTSAFGAAGPWSWLRGTGCFDDPDGVLVSSAHVWAAVTR